MSLFLNHKKKIVENFYLDSLKARMIVPISKWWHRHTHCQLAHYLVAAVVVFFNSCHYIIMKGIVSILKLGLYGISESLFNWGGSAWEKGDPAKIFWKYFQNKWKSWSYKTTNLTEKWKNCWVFWRKSRYFDWFIMDFQ